MVSVSHAQGQAEGDSVMKAAALTVGTVLGMLVAAYIGFATGSDFTRARPTDRWIDTYDARDARYKYIPEAPEEWRVRFGDSERTRVLQSLSEVRVIMDRMSRRIVALEKANEPADPNAPADPNEVKGVTK